MIDTQESLGTVRALLNEAATLCRKERKKLLLYFISMALAELETEIADEKLPAHATRH